MKKRILVLGLGICLLFSACGGKKTAEEEVKQPGTKQQEMAEGSEDEPETAEQEDNKNEAENKQKTEGSKDNKSEKDKPEDSGENEEESEDSEEVGKELSQVPEITFIDYSQEIKDEESGVLLLSVTENCPVISIPENEAIAEKINMAFEQQHTANQTYIAEDTETARSAYKDLDEEDQANWTGYGYGATYKMVYASTRILSIKAESYEWQGTPHPNTWTSSYCFDVTTGKLLSLADIFTDKAKAGKIVEQHILDTITADPYKDYLMEDYESYVPDVLTEDVFYLNENGLVVICNPYLVTEYAGGLIEIEVPYEELAEVMNETYVLNK